MGLLTTHRVWPSLPFCIPFLWDAEVAHRTRMRLIWSSLMLDCNAAYACNHHSIITTYDSREWKEQTLHTCDRDASASMIISAESVFSLDHRMQTGEPQPFLL